MESKGCVDDWLCLLAWLDAEAEAVACLANWSTPISLPTLMIQPVIYRVGASSQAPLTVVAPLSRDVFASPLRRFNNALAEAMRRDIDRQLVHGTR